MATMRTFGVFLLLSATLSSQGGGWIAPGREPQPKLPDLARRSSRTGTGDSHTTRRISKINTCPGHPPTLETRRNLHLAALGAPRRAAVYLRLASPGRHQLLAMLSSASQRLRAAEDGAREATARGERAMEAAARWRELCIEAEAARDDALALNKLETSKQQQQQQQAPSPRAALSPRSGNDLVGATRALDAASLRLVAAEAQKALGEAARRGRELEEALEAAATRAADAEQAAGGAE